MYWLGQHLVGGEIGGLANEFVEFIYELNSVTCENPLIITEWAWLIGLGVRDSKVGGLRDSTDIHKFNRIECVHYVRGMCILRLYTVFVHYGLGTSR